MVAKPSSSSIALLPSQHEKELEAAVSRLPGRVCAAFVLACVCTCVSRLPS
jgi:hypothetical protein